jgi:hypothetical protein
MIYLISKNKKGAHIHNELIVEIAKARFKDEVFMPINITFPFDTHNELEFQVFNEDLNVIKRASLPVVSLPIGNGWMFWGR